VILNSEPLIPDPKHVIPDPKHVIPDLKSMIPKLYICVHDVFVLFIDNRFIYFYCSYGRRDRVKVY